MSGWKMLYFLLGKCYNVFSKLVNSRKESSDPEADGTPKGAMTGPEIVFTEGIASRSILWHAGS